MFGRKLCSQSTPAISATPACLTAKGNGESAYIIGIDGGGRVRSRLESMGLVPGTEIRIVNNGGRGPLLISLGEGRLTIGRGIAEKVFIA